MQFKTNTQVYLLDRSRAWLLKYGARIIWTWPPEIEERKTQT